MVTSDEPIHINSRETASQFLDDHDVYLFDCDGVLWLGTHLLPQTQEFLDMLEKRGKKSVFVTNNSTKSRKAYAKKFASFGITVREDQIFTSGYAAALYVKDFLGLVPKKDKIWVFGKSGITEELGLLGFDTLGGPDKRLDEPFDAEKSPFLVDGLDPAVSCVVAGLDPDISYHRLAISLKYLQQENVHFVGTNVDSTFPQRGHILPGAGSMIESLAVSSNRRPTYCGKPNVNMLKTILAAGNFDPSRCCMVGDRLNTDIRFGVDGKLKGTLLVLSGIETEERAMKVTEEYPRPKYFVEKLGDIYDLLN